MDFEIDNIEEYEEGVYQKLAKAIAKNIDIELGKTTLADLLSGYVKYNTIKSFLQQKLEQLKEQEQELSDEQGYWGGSNLQEKIELIEEILEESEK